MSYMFAAGVAITSAYSSIENNKAIRKSASSQRRSNRLFAERDRLVSNNQQLLAGDDVNRELGSQLSNLAMQALQAKGKAISQGADSNIYGNLAQRRQAVLGVQEALSVDSLQQQAESKMQDIQTNLTNIAYGNEAKNVEITNNYNNSMLQQQSTLEIVSSSVQAGLSVYSMGGMGSTTPKKNFSGIEGVTRGTPQDMQLANQWSIR